jgi:hypothetical protein
VADKATADKVGQKFQEWAQSLPSDEQGALAEWLENSSGAEVKGYQANWWQQENAWWNNWQSSWSE